MLFLVLNTALSLTTLVVLLWGVGVYIRARRQIRKLISLLHTKTPVKKKMDDLLEGLLTEKTTVTPASISSANALAQEVAEQREKLAIIAAGGRARQYLGKAWSVKEIDALGGWKALLPLRGKTGVCHYKNSGTRGFATVHSCGQYVSPYPSRESKAARG